MKTPKLIFIGSLLALIALLGCSSHTPDFSSPVPSSALPTNPLPIVIAAPTWTLPQLGGPAVSLRSLRGETILLTFWASWCAVCVHDLPTIEQLYKNYSPQGLKVISIAVDDDPSSTARLAKKLGLTFPILIDPTSSTQRNYGALSLPTTVLIDRQQMIRALPNIRTGKLSARLIGSQPWDDSRIRGAIESLLPNPSNVLPG